MKFVIVGAGRVGRRLARELSRIGHDLVVVERDGAALSALADQVDIAAVAGDARDLSLFIHVCEDADALVTVTESDETNLALCLLGRRIGVGRRIARIRNEKWFAPGALTQEDVGIDVLIHPEVETVAFLDAVISIQGAFDYALFADGEVALVGFTVGETTPLAGMTLAEMRGKYGLDYFLVIGLYRENRFTVPGGQDSMQVGDKVWILTAAATLDLVRPLFGSGVDESKDMLILGSSRIGMKVAEAFLAKGKKVTMLEPDEEKARRAAEALSGLRVLKVDITDGPEALREFDLAHLSVFIAATDDAKTNVMTSLLAKRLGAKRVVAITDEPAFLPVMNAIGLDIIADPHLLAAGAILRSVRKGLTHAVAPLMAGEGEIIEFSIPATCRVAGKSLAKAGIPRGAIVGMLIRDDDIIIPGGADELRAGDRAVVVAAADVIPEVEGLFAPKSGLFTSR